MSLFLVVAKEAGHGGAPRTFRGSRAEAEAFHGDVFEVIELVVGGCLLGPELKEAESGGGPATGSGQPETCCGEAPTVDREAPSVQPAKEPTP